MESHSGIERRAASTPGGADKKSQRKRKGGPSPSPAPAINSVLPQPLLRTLVRLLREAANGALVPKIKKRSSGSSSKSRKGRASQQPAPIPVEAWSPHWGNVQLVTLFARHMHAEFTAQGQSLETLQAHAEKIFELAVSNALGSKGGSSSHAYDTPAPLACLVAQATDMIVASRLFAPDKIASAFLPPVAVLLESVVSAWTVRSDGEGDHNLVRLIDTCEDVGILLYSFDCLLQEAHGASSDAKLPKRAGYGVCVSGRLYDLILAGLRSRRCDARTKSLHILEQLVEQKISPLSKDGGGGGGGGTNSALPFPSSLELIHHLQFVERRGHVPMEERKVTNVVEQICQAAQQRRLSDGDRIVAICHAVGLVSVA